MLTHLSIRDYTLVDRLDLELAPGLTVVTGETGAGKSLLLDALGLLLGDRAEARAVRPDCPRATLAATFDLSNRPEALAWLREQALDDENQCLIRRVIQAAGGSKAFVNGQPVTVQDLKTLGEHLADIHSQHEHQSLLKKATQRRLLDTFGDHTTLADTVAELAREWRSTHETLETLQNTTEAQDARAELLRFQLDELDALNLTPDELPELEARQKALAHAEESLAACETVLQLSEGDDASLSALLQRIRQTLTALPHQPEAVTETLDLFESARIHVDEACDRLRQWQADTGTDPEALRAVEARLGTVFDLARKHRVAPEALAEHREALAAEQAQLQRRDDNLTELRERLDRLRRDFDKQARALSRKRQKAAEALAEAVNARLEKVGLPRARFAVALTPFPGELPDARGREDVIFRVQTNPGQPEDTLARVASGGELSRLSLVINVVTAGTRAVPTLVFDEVDVGISGPVADAVGRLLYELGTRGQVLCVTHQPQVAARGDCHLDVSKAVENDTTRTVVTALDTAGREDALAHMLGGETVSEKSRAHAREMLENR